MTTDDALSYYYLVIGEVTLAALAYAFIVRRVAEMMQPLRLKLAERGATALGQSTISESDKDLIRFMLTEAYSRWPAWVLAVVLPFELIRMLGRRQIDAPGRNDECGQLGSMFLVSSLAASPLASIIVLIELLTIGFAAFLVNGHVAVARAVLASQRVEARGWGHAWLRST